MLPATCGCRRITRAEPDTRAYKTGATTKRDPFQNLYVQIADDLSAARAKLKPADFERIRNVASLRFDSELAPYAYQGYLQKQRDGTYKILRLPAEDSPLSERLQQVRERDYALLDTVDDQYQLSAEKITDSYVNWRRSSYSELEQEADLKHSAHMRMLLGAAAVIGGIAAATESNNSARPDCRSLGHRRGRRSVQKWNGAELRSQSPLRGDQAAT